MKKILLLNGDTDYNLGDSAIQTALCHQLASTASNLRITITSRRPHTSDLPAVARVIPRGTNGLKDLLSSAASSDLVVVGGGGLFQDDDSRIKMPFWAGMLAMLKTTNRNLVGHCIGAGPLKHRESRCFARLACATLTSISVRDHYAHQWLSSCTAREIKVVPDPAFMLPPASQAEADRLIAASGLPSHRPIIGVALRRWFHPLGGFVPHRLRFRMKLDRAHGATQLETMLDQFALALLHIAQQMNASVLMLPTYTAAHEDDTAVCTRLMSKLNSIPTSLLTINEPRLYKAVTGRLHMMIASRMHPLILAAGMGTPIVGFSYNGKFDGLFELLQLPQRPLSMDRFGNAMLIDNIEESARIALTQSDALRARAAQLANVVAQHTTALINSIPHE